MIAVTFLTYLWHYVASRLIYDQLVRGHLVSIVAVAFVAAAAFLLGRRTGGRA